MSHCSQEGICLCFKGDLLCSGGIWCAGGAQMWQWMCPISVTRCWQGTELRSEQHSASRDRSALLQLSSGHLNRLQSGEILQQAGKQRDQGNWRCLEPSPCPGHAVCSRVAQAGDRQFCQQLCWGMAFALAVGTELCVPLLAPAPLEITWDRPGLAAGRLHPSVTPWNG